MLRLALSDLSLSSVDNPPRDPQANQQETETLTAHMRTDTPADLLIFRIVLGEKTEISESIGTETCDWLHLISFAIIN